jgi:hypothetical protein
LPKATRVDAGRHSASSARVLVTACGRICMHRKKIHISYVLAGQRLASRKSMKTSRS